MWKGARRLFIETFNEIPFGISPLDVCSAFSPSHSYIICFTNDVFTVKIRTKYE